MNGFDCPECENHLKEGSYSCMCGWRSKPKDPPKPKNCCRKCGDLDAHRCGPDDAPFFLCDPHREEMKANLAEAKEERKAIQEESKPDYLTDLSEGKLGG